MKKSLSTILCIALALVLLFSFAGCNKVTTKDIDSASAYELLMNDQTGVIILGRNDTDFTSEYTLNDGDVTESGTATLCMDNDYVSLNKMQETPIVHSVKTVVEDNVTTVTEYYVGYIKAYQSYDGYTKKTKIMHLYQVTTDGVVTNSGYDELKDTEGNTLYNNLCTDCGIYTGRNYIESILEYCEEPTFSGKQFIEKKQVKYTEVYISYSYDDADNDVTGHITVTIAPDNTISKITVSESDGFEYSATYTYGAAHFEMPTSI